MRKFDQTRSRKLAERRQRINKRSSKLPNIMRQIRSLLRARARSHALELANRYRLSDTLRARIGLPPAPVWKFH